MLAEHLAQAIRNLTHCSTGVRSLHNRRHEVLAAARRPVQRRHFLRHLARTAAGANLAQAFDLRPLQRRIQFEGGIATLVVLVVLMGVLAVPGLRRPDGRAFLIAVGLWAVARSVVVTTWRDPVTVGPFRTEQVIALLIAIACLIGFVGLIRREGPSSPALATG